MSIDLYRNNEATLATVNVLIYNQVNGMPVFRLAPWPYNVLPHADEKIYFKDTSPLLVENVSWRNNGIVIHAQHISYVANSRHGNPVVTFGAGSPFKETTEQELLTIYDN